MDNFIFSLQALALNIKLTIIALLRHQVMWGFGLGFTAATLVYAFIVSESPRRIPAYLTKNTRDAFLTLIPKASDGIYKTSFLAFQRDYNKVKLSFYCMVLAFLIVIAIALLKF
jgi:hypothetical protein